MDAGGTAARRAREAAARSAQRTVKARLKDARTRQDAVKARVNTTGPRKGCGAEKPVSVRGYARPTVKSGTIRITSYCRDTPDPPSTT